MPDRRTSLVRIAAALGLAHLPALHAQERYPSKPLRLVVGFPAGGATDALARLFAQRLSEQMPQRMLVDNRPGAGANLAADHVAKASPDGYTVLFTHVATHGIGPAVYSKLPYDPIRDFQPVSILAVSPLVLLARPSLPAANLDELARWSKAQNRSLTIGYPGNGTSGHLSSALLQLKSGLNLTLVPYKGGAPATQDLLGGQIDLLFDPLNSALQLARSGQSKPLGVTSEERSATLPGVPALAESIPGFRVLTWYGFAVPAKTPDPVVERLAAECAAAVKSPGLRRQLMDMGLTPTTSSPSEFTAWIRRELDHWAAVAKAANIRLE